MGLQVPQVNDSLQEFASDILLQSSKFFFLHKLLILDISRNAEDAAFVDPWIKVDFLVDFLDFTECRLRNSK